MNIIIDYDFLNAVCDIKEGFTPIKVYRNNKSTWLKFNIPVLVLFEYLIVKSDILKYLPSAIITHFIFVFLIELMTYKGIGDHYKTLSLERLLRLIPRLEQAEILTSLALIKSSKCYNKVYNLHLNTKKLPEILESKYILVPTYEKDGTIKDTSILQEHVVGSKVYKLSLGKPVKELKVAYVNL